MRTEKFDYCTVRDSMDSEAQRRMAVRLYRVLKPLYGHIENEPEDFFLDKVVLDSKAKVFRGYWFVDDAGMDRGNVAVRIVESVHEGRTFAHATLHLGLHPEARGEGTTGWLAIREMFRYRIRHPMRPVFVIDTPISAASYRKTQRLSAELYPTPKRGIPDHLWRICETAAQDRGWQPIEGCAREARQVNRPMKELARADSRPASDEYQKVARWFSQITRDTPGSGLLVIVPVTLTNLIRSSLKIGWRELRSRIS